MGHAPEVRPHPARRGQGARADERLVAIPCDSLETLEETEETAIWKIQEVPSVRWFYNVHFAVLPYVPVERCSKGFDGEFRRFDIVVE